MSVLALVSNPRVACEALPLGVLQCAGCAYRVTQLRATHCCQGCVDTAGGFHDESCKKVPLSGVYDDLCKKVPSSGGTPQGYTPASTPFEDRLRELILSVGPIHLAAIPQTWDSRYGLDTWVAERPVKSAQKACSPPYATGIAIIDSWVHIVEDLKDVRVTEKALATSDIELAQATSVDVKEVIALECKHALAGHLVSISYARSQLFWRCNLKATRIPKKAPIPDLQDPSATEDQNTIEEPLAESMGYGSNIEEALMMARRYALDALGRWCDESEQRMKRLLQARAQVKELKRLAGDLGMSEEADVASELDRHVDQVINSLQLLLKEPPPCKCACLELAQKCWPFILASGNDRLIERAAKMLRNSVVLPLESWISLVETAAWYLSDVLYDLEHVEITESSLATRYVYHNLFSLFLEHRAQLLQERHSKSPTGATMDVKWRVTDAGWACSFAAEHLATRNKGTALEISSLQDERIVVLCECVEEGKGVLREIPNFHVLQKLLSASSVFVQVIQCHSVVHARQKDALLGLLSNEEGGFNSTLKSLVVDTWTKELELAEANEAIDKGSVLAAEPPPFTQHEVSKTLDVTLKLDRANERSPMLDNLTNAQQEALQNAASRRLSLVRGPPGTGKTHVAAAIVADSKSLLPPGSRVLIATQSHAAAINLHKRLEAFGVKTARVGMTLHPSEVCSQSLFKATFDLDTDDPDVQLMLDIAADGSTSLITPASLAVQLKVMRILAKQAEAVVMTCASSGNRALLRGLGPFPLLVLDEAAQCVEPASLVPLNLGCQCFAMIGDEKQLPATVLDRRAERRNFGCSFFERCVLEGVVTKGDGFVQLDEQRRMHPSISAFPSARFYNGDVCDAIEVPSRREIAGFPWPPGNCRVCFVDLGFTASEVLGHSRSNTEEALALVRVLRSCLNAGIDPSDVAVITGYSAQQQVLKHMIRKMKEATNGLKVDTVDGFQGAERDLVLVSTVRTNARSQVGFLRDPRRVNVLLTRARCGLIAFGDASTLEGEADTWRPWLAWLREQNAIIQVKDLDHLDSVNQQVKQVEQVEQGERKEQSKQAEQTEQADQLEQEGSSQSGWETFWDPATQRPWQWNASTQTARWLS